MMSIAEPSLFARFVAEMRPYPGRMGHAARMAICCMIVTVLSMALEVPEAAVSCYLIFFAAKDDAAASLKTSVALIFGSAFGIGIGFIFVMLSAAEPMVRLILMVVFTFAGMFFAQASRLGPVASTVGFVLALVMTLFDDVPVPELLTRGLLWMWVVVALPMAVLAAVSLIGGRDPYLALRSELAARFAAMARLARSGDTEARQALHARLSQGNSGLLALLPGAGLRRSLEQGERTRLSALISSSYGLMALVWAKSERGETLPEGFVLWCEAAEADLSGDAADLPQDTGLSGEEAAVAGHLAALIRGEADGVDDVLPASAKAPFLAPDAFDNPDYVHFALKTTLAVVLCYLIYTSLNWFGIHTALVTCYYVALSSLGETLHKLALRLTGCLIGAGLGVFAIIVVMPHMEDVGHLALLVGAVSFLAAWVAKGSVRVSYMGWQIALAFFLCVLHGQGPSYDLVTARDRVLGILLGLAVMSLVFSQLWPVTVAPHIGKALVRARSALASGLRAPGDLTWAEAYHQARAEAARLFRLRIFEPVSVAMGEGETASLAGTLANLDKIAAPLTLLSQRSAPSSDSRESELREAFAQALEQEGSVDASRIAVNLSAGPRADLLREAISAARHLAETPAILSQDDALDLEWTPGHA